MQSQRLTRGDSMIYPAPAYGDLPLYTALPVGLGLVSTPAPFFFVSTWYYLSRLTRETRSMPYIFDDTANPNVDPAYGDKLSVGDVSDITNNAEGDTKTTTVQQLVNHLEINPQSGTTYTLVLGDRAKTVTMSNASANTLTIPTNASVAFPIGTSIIIRQIGAGATTVTADTGVTLDGTSAGSATASAQFKAIVITKMDTNTWYIDGAVGAVS